MGFFPKGHWGTAGCERSKLKGKPSEAHPLIVGNIIAPSGEAPRLGLLLHAAPLSGGSCCVGSDCELHDGLLLSGAAEGCSFAFSSMLPIMNHLLSGRISSATSSPSTALFWDACPCSHAHSHFGGAQPRKLCLYASRGCHLLPEAVLQRQSASQSRHPMSETLHKHDVDVTIISFCIRGAHPYHQV